MKKTLSVVLILTVLLTMFTACSDEKQNIQTHPEYKEKIVIGTPTPVNNLNLQLQNDAINNTCLRLTHDTLITHTSDGDFEPNICTDWLFMSDNKVRFTIRNDVKFSDGTPLTVEDIKFTFDMGLNLKLPILRGLKEVKIIDDDTIDFIIDRYSNEFIQSLSTQPLGIQSKKAYDEKVKHPYLIGSGPYVAKEWDHGNYIVFEKNENYWDKEPKTEKIVFKTIFDATNRADAVINGDIDICLEPNIDDYDRLWDDQNVTVESREGTRLFYLGFNIKQTPWDNKLLREAISHSIDRSEIINKVLNGKACLIRTVLNPGLWGFDNTVKDYSYDIELAKQKLKESGFVQTEPIELLVSIENVYSEIAEIIANSLEKIGLEVTVKTLRPAQFQRECSVGYQGMFLWRWNESTMADLVYRPLYYTGSKYNYFHYSNAETDKLIDSILFEKNQNKRLKSTKALQEKLVSECIEIPLFVKDVVIAYNKDLKGLNLYGGSNHDWSNVYIQK